MRTSQNAADRLAALAEKAGVSLDEGNNHELLILLLTVLGVEECDDKARRVLSLLLVSFFDEVCEALDGCQ